MSSTVGGLAAFSSLGVGGLPVFALPVILLGAPTSRGLVNTALLGAAGFVAFAALGAVILVYDAPLRWAGRTAQGLANWASRKRPPLELAEVDSSQAVLATLAYRIASYWVPLCVGPVAYGLFRIRYRTRLSPRGPSPGTASE